MVGEVGFKPWVRITKRLEMDERDLPGVYFISIGEKPPPDYRVNNGRIVYIGETTGQTFEKRLYQFIATAYQGQKLHSGGGTFSFRYSKKTPLENVWVSVCPVQMGEIYTSAYIKYLERRLIWEYVCTYGELPPCNSD